jgi:hypothetical protein
MATEKGSATPSARRSSDTIASEERAVAAMGIPEKNEKDHAVAADAESDGNADEKAKEEGTKDGKEGKEGSLKDYFVSYSCTKSVLHLLTSTHSASSPTPALLTACCTHWASQVQSPSVLPYR